MLRDSLLDAYGEHGHMGLTGERVARRRDHPFRGRRVRAPQPSRRGAGQRRRDVRRQNGRRASRRGGPVAWATMKAPGATRPSSGWVGSLRRSPPPRSDRGQLLPAVGRGRRAAPRQRGGGAAPGNRRSLGSIRARSAAWRPPTSWVADPDRPGAPEAGWPRRLGDRPGRAPDRGVRLRFSSPYRRPFHFPDERFNVHGGSLALGHPIGASGARIVVTLIHELIRSRGRLGLATLCMGGGNGLSVIVERERAPARDLASSRAPVQTSPKPLLDLVEQREDRAAVSPRERAT